MSTRWFGAPVPRRDDARLLLGRGRYLDDIALPDMAHVALVRSVQPRARLQSVDVSRARPMSGVLDIVSHADLQSAGVPFPQLLPHHGLVSATWCALAPGRVCFVGEPIAAVVASSKAAALDAAEHVEVIYETQEPVLDVEAAVRPGSPAVHPHIPSNTALHLKESSGDVARVLAGAPHRLAERFRLTRGAGMPMEPRGVVAQFDPDRRELTIW